ncbi:TonB-dependent receptor [Roseateles sp. DAIF2]|uniref:TonB-dependent receptor plug domain-containing protein n=1 Tax=Roseateles sp. DAIF2 TaxID=2714952 RepID=UPI0018A2A491|nr:TonB-dependent receptor [Roseateles sp. DAIF2]QPF76000.1 TonB-dependent receptor [Roseateles sp. DAIF2]
MFKLNAVSFAVATIAAAAALPALAQDQQLERVVVTGSAIKRIAAEGALPVQTISKQEIERSGVTSVVELMQNLSSIQGGVVEGDTVGGGGGGQATVSIHNLGGDRTLVLLNGRRMIGEAGGSVDLNMIPLAIVERVEVLTDGASALYGSDAVAGVVNFITRTNSSKRNITLSASVPSESGGKERNASISGGFGDLDTDGFNVIAGLSIDKRDALNASQREFSKTGVIHFGFEGKRYEFFNGSGSSIPGNVNVPIPKADGTYDTVARNAYLAQNGKCAPMHVKDGDSCSFDYAGTVQAFPDRERSNFFGSFSKKLGENHLFRADVLLGKTKTSGKIAAVPGQVLVDVNGPFAKELASVGYTPAYLSSIGLDPNRPAAVSYRVYDLGNRTSTFERDTKGLWLSLEGQLAGWDYNASLGYQRALMEESNAGYPLANAFGALLRSGIWNPFALPGQQSQAAMDAAKAIMISGVYDSEKSTLMNADVRASRELFALGGGKAALAVGASFSQDKVSTDPGAVARGVGGPNGNDQRFGDGTVAIPYSAKRDTMGLFGELVAPISKTFELTAGLRYDDYRHIASATNGKVSFRFQPSPVVLLRGSIGTGFRVPTLRQLYRPLQEFGVTAEPYACSDEMSAMAKSLGAACQGSKKQYNVYTGGNKAIQPEESKQATLGVRIEPSSSFSVGADWWWVGIDKTFGSVDENEAFGNVNKYSNLWMVYTDPVTKEKFLAYNASQTNLGKSYTSGIDFDATARFDTPLGKLTSNLRATYMLRSKKQLLAGGEYFSTVADNHPSIGDVTFRWKGQLTNTLQSGRWIHAANINFQSGYKDFPTDVYGIDANGNYNGDDRTVRLKVKPYATLDWQTTYAWNKQLTLTGGVKNVFDKEPPLSLRAKGGHMLGFDYRYYSPLGRTLQVKASYDF